MVERIDTGSVQDSVGIFLLIPEFESESFGEVEKITDHLLRIEVRDHQVGGAVPTALPMIELADRFPAFFRRGQIDPHLDLSSEFKGLVHRVRLKVF